MPAGQGSTINGMVYPVLESDLPKFDSVQRAQGPARPRIMHFFGGLVRGGSRAPLPRRTAAALHRRLSPYGTMAFVSKRGAALDGPCCCVRWVQVLVYDDVIPDTDLPIPSQLRDEWKRHGLLRHTGARAVYLARLSTHADGVGVEARRSRGADEMASYPPLLGLLEDGAAQTERASVPPLLV